MSFQFHEGKPKNLQLPRSVVHYGVNEVSRFNNLLIKWNNGFQIMIIIYYLDAWEIAKMLEKKTPH